MTMPKVSMQKSVKWVAVGNIINKAAGFVFGVILARLLMPKDFGLVLTIQIFTGVVGIFSSAGLGRALIQAKKIEWEDYNVVFTVQLIFSSAVYLVFFTLAPWFAGWFGNSVYESLMRVSALSFFLRPFVNIGNTVLHRGMHFRERAIVGFVSMVVGSIISVVLALMGDGPWSLVLGGLFGSIMSIPLLLFFSKWRPGLVWRGSTIRRLGSYGVKATAIDVLEYFRNQTSNLLVAKILGPGPVGIFNKSYSLSVLPMQVIGASTHPPLFRALATMQDDIQHARYLYYKTIQVVMLYTLPIYVCLGYVAQEFIVVVFGDHWASAGPLLQVLVLTAPFRCIGNSSGAAVEALNRIGQEVRISLENWILLSILVFMGLSWHLNGVVTAVIVAFITYSVRIYFVAQGCVQGSLGDLVKAVRSAVLLNSLLLAVLYLADTYIIPNELGRMSILYVLVMAGISVLVYSIAFATVPLPELASERQRVKEILKSMNYRPT